MRLTKLLPGAEQGACLVLEAASYEGGAQQGAVAWAQVRIASLRPAGGSGGVAWRLGVYGQSPVKQSGGRATFHELRLGGKVATVHEAALPEGHGGL